MAKDALFKLGQTAPVSTQYKIARPRGSYQADVEYAVSKPKTNPYIPQLGQYHRIKDRTNTKGLGNSKKP